MKSISVIIPSYNSAGTIGFTLKALLKISARLNEIIIVDSSDDGKTKEVLQQYEARAKIMHLNQKTMPAIGRNIGARHASGETLAFIDSDAYPDENWLERITDARAAGTRVGGGSIQVPEFQKNNALALAQFYLQFNEFMPCGLPRQKEFIPSCNLFCEKALFDLLGGFPEIRASEDVLFGLKANAVSRVMFYPQMKVFHIFRTRLKTYLSNQIMLGEYVLLYRRTHYGGFLYQPGIATLLTPAFVGIKFIRIALRVLKIPGNRLRFLWALPLFLLGLTCWTIGFLKASVSH
ncbi:MAG: glycosyltransferase [Candidatus Omnitrophica bacterium]|nr:glycosyltransferase [Candidatus Omnitrophota bacterium]